MMQAFSNTLAPVLLADDDPDDLEFFEQAWQQLNLPHPLISFTDGKDLLEYLHQQDLHEPILILLDWYMPKVNGQQVCQHLQAHESLKHIPIIVMTSTPTPDMHQACDGEGEWLPKATSQQELHHQLQWISQHYLVHDQR